MVAVHLPPTHGHKAAGHCVGRAHEHVTGTECAERKPYWHKAIIALPHEYAQ